MAPLLDSGQLMARSISRGGIAGAVVGAIVGSLFFFLLFLPFILRAFRGVRYRRKMASEQADMAFAGHPSSVYDPAPAGLSPSFYHQTTLPAEAKSNGYDRSPDAHHPSASVTGAPSAPAGPTTAPSATRSNDTKNQEPTTASSEQQEPPAHQSGSQQSLTVPDAPDAVEASNAGEASAASQSLAKLPGLEPSETAPAPVQALQTVPSSPQASDEPAVLSVLSARSEPHRPPAIVTNDSSKSVPSSASLPTPPPLALARGTSATFPAFGTQPTMMSSRQRSSTTRSFRSRGFLDRAASIFRQGSSHPMMTRSPSGSATMARSPLMMGFQDINGPDHHSWLMGELGLQEDGIPSNSVFEVDLNNLSGASAEYYSGAPLSPPTDPFMSPISYAAMPPSAVVTSLASIASAGALVGVSNNTKKQPKAISRAGSLRTSAAASIASALPLSPTSPVAAPGDATALHTLDDDIPLEELREELRGESREESSPEPPEFPRSPSHHLVPSPRLPAPGTVNPRDVWAPATDDERFVHKTAELDRIEQSPPPVVSATGPSAEDTNSLASKALTSLGGSTVHPADRTGDDVDPIVVPGEFGRASEFMFETDFELHKRQQPPTAPPTAPPTDPGLASPTEPDLTLTQEQNGLFMLEKAQAASEATVPNPTTPPASSPRPKFEVTITPNGSTASASQSGNEAPATAMSCISASTTTASSDATVSNGTYTAASFAHGVALTGSAHGSVGGYMRDDQTYPLSASQKLSNHPMVQQSSDAPVYWQMPMTMPMHHGLPVMQEPFIVQDNTPLPDGMRFGGYLMNGAGMVSLQSRSAGMAPSFALDTPQSSPGHMMTSFPGEVSMQMGAIAQGMPGNPMAVPPMTPPPTTQFDAPQLAPHFGSADQPSSPSNHESTPGHTSMSSPQIFNCDNCGRVFDQIHKLNHHKRYHERPHECTVAGCGKRFGTKTHLDRHVNDKHSKSRKYHCTEVQCPYSVVGGKSFPRKDNWRRHMVNKHGLHPDHDPIEVIDQPMTGMQSTPRTQSIVESSRGTFGTTAF